MPKPSKPLAPALLLPFVLLAGACANPGSSSVSAEPESRASSRVPSASGFDRARAIIAARGSEDAGPRARADPRDDPRDPFIADFLDAHNLARASVSPASGTPLPELEWSEELAAHARSWAARCEWEHSGSGYGENLAARTGDASPEAVVADWMSEAPAYDPERGRCVGGEVCEHYTQVVWRTSTKLGCAVSECSGGGPFGGGPWSMWVCNYDPPGNYVGERPY